MFVTIGLSWRSWSGRCCGGAALTIAASGVVGVSADVSPADIASIRTWPAASCSVCVGAETSDLVPPELIEANGAVSRPGRPGHGGAFASAPVRMSASITGIAGPGGGTPQKPPWGPSPSRCLSDAPARVRTIWAYGGRTRSSSTPRRRRSTWSAGRLVVDGAAVRRHRAG